MQGLESRKSRPRGNSRAGLSYRIRGASSSCQPPLRRLSRAIEGPEKGRSVWVSIQDERLAPVGRFGARPETLHHAEVVGRSENPLWEKHHDAVFMFHTSA